MYCGAKNFILLVKFTTFTFQFKSSSLHSIERNFVALGVVVYLAVNFLRMSEFCLNLHLVTVNVSGSSLKKSDKKFKGSLILHCGQKYVQN